MERDAGEFVSEGGVVLIHGLEGRARPKGGCDMGVIDRREKDHDIFETQDRSHFREDKYTDHMQKYQTAANASANMVGFSLHVSLVSIIHDMPP